MFKRIIGIVAPNWQLHVVGLVTFAIVASLLLGYRHYNNLLLKISTLETNDAKMELAVKTQGNTINAQSNAIDEWEKAQEKMGKTIAALAANDTKSEQELRRLSDVFARHNLENLAKRKPGLIERRINDGSERTRRMLECATDFKRQGCSD